MRVERGGSQILFGMLPSQTVDLEGRVWQVARWVDPPALTLDQGSLRRALLEAITPWSAGGVDNGLSAELFAQAPVEAVSVNRDRGVLVAPFPNQWRCRQCGRITSQRPDRCRCGSSSSAQMQFVAYHQCGALGEPMLPRCPTHRTVAVRLPGTASARELTFFCPDCNRRLSQGFPYQRCSCGNAMSITVHRAGAVFTPQYTVLVNPADPALAAQFRATGGAARALQWVLNGLGADDVNEAQTVDGLIEMLRQQNISEETARQLAELALQRGEVRQSAGGGEVAITEPARTRALDEATSLNSAVMGGRTRIQDMVEGTTPPLRTLYDAGYPAALAEARLCNVELLTNFPVATLAYGFTRGGLPPGQSPLTPFRDRGQIRCYGTLARTEALLFQLDPLEVHRYMADQGFPVRTAETPREARVALLQGLEVPAPGAPNPQPYGGALVTLLHSYAHRLIRTLATEAGIERDGLAEYLLPHHLSIVVYASARGEFVLGGLQALFETALNRVLSDFVLGEYRCPLDPGCRSGGGACMACLHLGEPSCRWFNRLLDRSVLFGQEGFLRSAL